MFEELPAIGGANVTIDMDGQQRLAEMNKGVTPVFFMEPVQNPAKTAEAGRPIFDQEERVRLFVAGDQFNQVVHPVSQELRERFPEQYRAWKEKKTEMTITGTPLRQWPLLSAHHVAEFEALKIFTVEALSSLPESALSRMQDMREWRAKAEAWLGSAKDGAFAVKLAEENEKLKDNVAALQQQIKDLADRVSAAENAKRKAA